ncbi:hypothetical protein [Chryseobacterium cucumeris]|uniref:hypothetical protein n=1 Tax=Chryseobacterium cucumeris TaxID=1813611 RepID=UPI003D98FE84
MKARKVKDLMKVLKKKGFELNPEKSIILWSMEKSLPFTLILVMAKLNMQLH